MASASFSEDLTCSICLTIFTDPVILLCGHSFCRECITISLSKQHHCPHCRTPVPTEGNYLLTSHILKGLAEKTKEAAKLKKEYRNDKEEVEWLCPEHEEKLKLFCVTDQQLTCVICRDAERHGKHKFKPIKEAAASLRQELEMFMQNVSADVKSLESVAKTQREEMTKTKERCHQLQTKISSQFEEIHAFLRKREKEINDELRHKEEDAFKKMSEKLNAIETALSENRELKGKVTSTLEIKDTERFLRSWTDDNTAKRAKNSLKPTGGNFQVEKSSISLGPYESHLQFFVWKEMLQVIKPREEMLSLRNDNTSLNVSQDQRSLIVCQFQSRNSHHAKRYNRYNQYNQYDQYDQYEANYAHQSDFTESTNALAGQHYWETDVGKMTYWELGVKGNFLQMNNATYQICTQGRYKTVTFEGTPRKIGIYLSCSSKELSFYDADKMKHIDTISLTSMSTPVSAYFKVHDNDASHTPLTVCWY